jgi:hypothetical protein
MHMQVREGPGAKRPAQSDDIPDTPHRQTPDGQSASIYISP